MKLIIGDNIRTYRRAINMTQEELARQLGVSYQSVSRWENGLCYPDMELLPALARIFSVTVDTLLGCLEDKKDKQFKKIIEQIKTSAIKNDADVIVSSLREIHRDYIDYANIERYTSYFNDIYITIQTNYLYNTKAILDELRILSDLILNESNNKFLKSIIIKAMTIMEDDNYITNFLNNNSTQLDLSQNLLLRERYDYRGEWEKIEDLRQMHLHSMIAEICIGQNVWYAKPTEAKYKVLAGNVCIQFLNNIRNINSDPAYPISGNGQVDMWADIILFMGIRHANYLAYTDNKELAFAAIEDVISLLEKVMALPDGTKISSNSPMLDRLEVQSKQIWDVENDDYEVLDMTFWGKNIIIITPDMYNKFLTAPEGWAWFNPIRDDSRYENYIRRVGALVQKREKQH